MLHINSSESRMHQHGSKHFARRPQTPSPPSNLEMGSIGQNSFFSEHGHDAYQLKWNHLMRQHGSKYFACRPHPPPPTTLGEGVKRSKSIFSEHGHVAYQIKGNHVCSNMSQLFCPQTLLTLGVKRSKFNFFQSNVILHVKLKGITNVETCRNYFAHRPPTPPC